MQDTHAMTQSRRHIGELAVMARQTEDAERKILAHAMQMHGDVLAKLDDMRPRVMHGEAEGRDYQALVAERGRLERVIAQARLMLGDAAT